jgi:thiol-disulfide isomerase/thioredoxin
MIPDVEFLDVAGRQHRLSECTGHALTVVAVTSTSCPISKRYLPTLAKLEKTYQDREVVFIFVNPTPSDSDADIRAAIETHDLQDAYFRDAEGKLLGPLGAKTTAECFVLDRA